MVAVLWLNHQGRLKCAVQLLIFTLLAMTTSLLCTCRDGFRDPALLAYPSVLAISGLLTGRRWFAGISLAVILCAGGVVLAEMNGWSATPYSGRTSLENLIDLVIVLSITALAIGLLNQSVRDNLEHAHRRADALREAEERYRTLFELAPYSVALSDMEGRYLDVNQSVCEFLNLPREQVIGRRREEFFEIADLEVSARIKGKLIAQGYLHNEDLDIVDVATGARRGILLSSRPIPLGGKICVMSVTVDVTERKRAEEALRESEAFRRRLFDTSRLPMVVMDAATSRFLDCNPAAAQAYGLSSREAVLGKTPLEVSAPVQYDGVSSAEKARWYLEKALADGSVVFEWRHQRPDGEIWDAEVHLMVFKSGERRLMQFSLLDITRRKQATDALAESEEKFRILFDLAPYAISLVDMEGRIVDINQEGCHSLYLDREQIIGRLQDEVFKTTDAEYSDRIKRKLMAQRCLTNEEVELVVSSNGARRVVLYSSRILPLAGRPCVISVTIDITEQKTLEANLLRMQRVESVGRLANGVAHDLNNILTPILMAADLLSRPGMDPEDQEYVQLIESSARRGTDIIKQLLLYSRGGDGKRRDLDLNKLMRETTRMVQETFPKSISLKVRASEQLWPISGDATQIHQVLLNLCVNARDAMAETGTLVVGAENVELDEASAQVNPEVKAGAYVALRVTDTGAGIPPEILDKIFDPLFTTKPVGQGTGLGLATVLGITKSHGGFVEVQSRMGEGTQFTVYLPASRDGRGSESPESTPITRRGAGQWILVVDDEEPIRRAARRALEANGYRVATASDGRESVALYALRKPAFQVVVLDMWMPFMDGVATIRQLAKLDPAVRILATSGLPEMRTQALQTDPVVKAFLPKPWNPHELLAALEKLLPRMRRP